MVTEQNPAILKAIGLQLYYGDFHALKNIHMEIPEKQITALIGPSGCGKSTFLKTLNRMNDLIPSVRVEGKVEFAGKDIFSKNIDVTQLRKRIGMVFQKPNPFPMSIYDNIAYGPRLHGTHKRAQLDELVEQSLKGAALWDEVKRSPEKKRFGPSLADNSSAYVLPGRWPCIRTYCLWMSPLALLIPFPPPKLRSWPCL